MSMTRNDGMELRERGSTPGVVNMDRFEADLGRVASPPTSPDALQSDPRRVACPSTRPFRPLRMQSNA
jgi:hypothetical protein